MGPGLCNCPIFLVCDTRRGEESQKVLKKIEPEDSKLSDVSRSKKLCGIGEQGLAS